MLNWETSREDMLIIVKIAERVEAMNLVEPNRRKLMMDIEACHNNGNPLDLQGLLEANEGDFRHDITGIIVHLDRQTGALSDCFCPRYSKSNAL